MEKRITRENGKFRCTLTDNGHTIATTLGGSVAEAEQWMVQQLDRIYDQGLSLLGDPPDGDPAPIMVP